MQYLFSPSPNLPCRSKPNLSVDLASPYWLLRSFLSKRNQSQKWMAGGATPASYKISLDRQKKTNLKVG